MKRFLLILLFLFAFMLAISPSKAQADSNINILKGLKSCGDHVNISVSKDSAGAYSISFVPKDLLDRNIDVYSDSAIGPSNPYTLFIYSGISSPQNLPLNPGTYVAVVSAVGGGPNIIVNCRSSDVIDLDVSSAPTALKHGDLCNQNSGPSCPDGDTCSSVDYPSWKQSSQCVKKSANCGDTDTFPMICPTDTKCQLTKLADNKTYSCGIGGKIDCDVCDYGTEYSWSTGLCKNSDGTYSPPPKIENCLADQCNQGKGCKVEPISTSQPLSLCGDINSNGSCLTALGLLPTNLSALLTRVFSIVLAIAGIAALGLIIASGYKLMVSQGNPEQVKGAREQLTAAIIGLLFIIFSLVILQVIGVNILNIPGFK